MVIRTLKKLTFIGLILINQILLALPGKQILQSGEDGIGVVYTSDIYKIQYEATQERITSRSLLPEKGVSEIERELIPVLTPGNKVQFFDGSFIVKFYELPDLHEFTEVYSVEVINTIESINRVVFRLENLADFESLIYSFKQEPNIEDVELNFYNTDLYTR